MKSKNKVGQLRAEKGGQFTADSPAEPNTLIFRYLMTNMGSSEDPQIPENGILIRRLLLYSYMH